MSRMTTTAIVSAFALTNIGLSWIANERLSFPLLCLVNFGMVITSKYLWRSIVIYTAKQLAKAEPIIAAALAHRD